MAPAAGEYARRTLDQFGKDFAKYFRGDLIVKDDRDISESDIANRNLILFGDPGSNSLIARILPKLPLRWTADTIAIGAKKFDAARHVPALIYPNPLNPSKYIVINSGHTFHEAELNSLNYLLFPRLGDWALLKVSGRAPADPSDALEEEVRRAGFFDERWRAR